KHILPPDSFDENACHCLNWPMLVADCAGTIAVATSKIVAAVKSMRPFMDFHRFRVCAQPFLPPAMVSNRLKSAAGVRRFAGLAFGRGQNPLPPGRRPAEENRQDCDLRHAPEPDPVIAHNHDG